MDSPPNTNAQDKSERDQADSIDLSLVSQFRNQLYVEIIRDICDPCDHVHEHNKSKT